MGFCLWSLYFALHGKSLSRLLWLSLFLLFVFSCYFNACVRQCGLVNGPLSWELRDLGSIPSSATDLHFAHGQVTLPLHASGFSPKPDCDLANLIVSSLGQGLRF